MNSSLHLVSSQDASAPEAGPHGTSERCRSKDHNIKRASYIWNVATGEMAWDGVGLLDLGVPEDRAASTIAAFKALIIPEHLSRWHDTVLAPPRDRENAAVARYRVEYRLLPSGRPGDEAVWIEEVGQCFFGDAGTPVRVRGSCRVVTTEYLEQRRRVMPSSTGATAAEDVTRIRLIEDLQTVTDRSIALRQGSAFLLISVDTLAQINSKFGFDIGDEVLGGVERILRSKLREGDVIGRYSPHKFGIVVQDCSLGAIGIVARRLIDAVRASRLETSACQLTTTISVGAVAIPEHAKTVPEALSRALEALDEAEAGNDGKLVVYSGGASQEPPRERNARVAGSIFSAIDEKRMVFVLQPIVDAVSGKPAMYECLLRIKTPDGNLVSAADFIGIAEELRLVRLIDHHTLELAVSLLKSNPSIILSLNVSGLTVSDHDWIVALYRLTGNQRSLLNRLMVEITETAVLEGGDAARAFVDVLRDIGCLVAIDDFGAGYTSIRHLREMPVDVLKIDGEFVKGLPEDQQGFIFVKSMVEMAKAVGMKTVAEWVPNAEAADMLTSIGVDYLQGFHYGEPFLPEDLKTV